MGFDIIRHQNVKHPNVPFTVTGMFKELRRKRIRRLGGFFWKSRKARSVTQTKSSSSCKTA